MSIKLSQCTYFFERCDRRKQVTQDQVYNRQSMCLFPSQIQLPSIHSANAYYASTVEVVFIQLWTQPAKKPCPLGAYNLVGRFIVTKPFQCFPKKCGNGRNPENTFCKFSSQLSKKWRTTTELIFISFAYTWFIFISTIWRPQFIKKIQISETPKFFHLFLNTSELHLIILTR